MKSIFFLPLAAILFLASCEKKRTVQESPKFVLSDTMAKMIGMDTVHYCNMASVLTLSGTVSFNENSIVKVFPRSGGHVLEAKLSLGDRVRKGQPLAVIRSADVAGTYSDLSSAEADLAIAKRELETTESLYRNGISSEKEYTEAKQNYHKALAGKAKAEAALKINGGYGSSSEGIYTLTAPIDGYIVEKKVNAGDFIRSDNAENLFTISDLKDVWIYAHVYEADIAKVKEGYPVTVFPVAYSDQELNGKIDQVSQVLDPESKAMRVRIVLDNQAMLLKPDMYVKVTVNNQENTQAVCVPSSAVITDDGNNYVVVYKSKTDLRVARIHILKKNGNHTYVAEGVQPGELVVTGNELLIFEQLNNE